ncbi:hypothetical protein Ocin01_15062 [Orchesella cincta]|uniref:Uncharacterized protein n=1 Tax=Orchesella cincta TaxID=48709 RepID=A0A1D2MF49_ORCCI|nr:hypothetical protein Ocin01_15062 [Orchesella cincta]
MASIGLSNLFLLWSSALFLLILIQNSNSAVVKESVCAYVARIADPCPSARHSHCNELCLAVAKRGACEANKCRCYGCNPGVPLLGSS